MSSSIPDADNDKIQIDKQDGRQDDEPFVEASSDLITPPKPILKSSEKCQPPSSTPEFPTFKSKVCRELSYKPTN